MVEISTVFEEPSSFSSSTCSPKPISPPRFLINELLVDVKYVLPKSLTFKDPEFEYCSSPIKVSLPDIP